jgi:hypothetical protein
MHARRYLFKALEFDQSHMAALRLIARLYAVENRAKELSLSAEQRLASRQRISARLLGKLHQYLMKLQPEVLPKSPSGAAVRDALNPWEALTRFLEDGELEIDNGATERANRDIALGRGNWTLFGIDTGGKTRRRRCEASSPPASAAMSNRLAGSAMYSRALHPPAERIASPQLEANHLPGSSLSRGIPVNHIKPTSAVHEPLTQFYDSRPGWSARFWRVSPVCYRAGRFQAASIRSPYSRVKWFSAVRQFGAGFHRLETFCSAKYSSFSADSSLGKEARVLITFRKVICSDSITLVV